jgi:putative sterol carrier protein
VAVFLSAEWVAALDAAATGSSVPNGLRLVVQQIVPDGDGGGEVAYAVRIADGTVRVASGRADDADVTFTQDRATAAAIATGELSAQAAFIDGRLRVGGDLSALLEHTAALAALDDVFASARAATVW